MLLSNIIELFIFLFSLIIVLMLLMGWGYLMANTMRFHSINKSLTFIMWLGFVFVLLFVELISIYFPINSNISLPFVIIGCIGLIFSYYKHLRPSYLYIKSIIFENTIQFIIIISIIVLWTIKSMGIPHNYDSGLYHFSSIRWLNEYPVTPGLGNLHTRLAYNQSYFSFLALLNIYPFWNKGYALGGLVLLTLSFLTIIEACLYKYKYGIIFILFSFLSLAESSLSLSSPTPDLPVNIIEIIIFILFFKLNYFKEKEKESIIIYSSIIFLLSFSLVTIKLSSSMYVFVIIILTIIYSYKTLLSNFNISLAIFFIFIFIIITHFIKGFILSGFPLFPSTFAGAWYLDWAVPIEKARLEVSAICEWARGYGLHPIEIKKGGWLWFPFWLSSFPKRGVFLFLSSFILIIINVLALMFNRKKLFKSINKNILSLYFPLISAVIFWFITAPDLRFIGPIPIILLAFSLWIFTCQHYIFIDYYFKNNRICIFLKKIHIYFLYSILIVGTMLTPINISGWNKIPTVKLTTVVTNSGLKIQVPVSGDQCWNAPIPNAPYVNPLLKLRSEKKGLMNGFTVINKPTIK